MATMNTSAQFLVIKSPYSSHNLTTASFPNLNFPSHHGRARRKLACSCVSMAGSGKPEDVVIVGAGIAGLATAVSLHRLGIRSLVLEQGDSLRTGGTSLTLSKNGWSVLDALGVGQALRTQFLEIQGILLKTDQGRVMRSFTFKDEDDSQKVRAVERRILLETLADQLPPDSIRFSSKLTNIRTSGDGKIVLDLVDGAQISPKIVVGCDGIRSTVAKYLGFQEPKYAGYAAFRGLAFYPEGQPHEPRVNYVYGKGLRAGFVPVSPNKVYWFICYNSATPGPKITDPSELKKKARELVKSWPEEELLRIIDQTPNETIIRTPLEDRWLWPVISPPVSKGGVVVAGDAWHPMTPNLGQGGCCALEDAVVLAKKLAIAMGSDREDGIDDALLLYQRERWPRVFPMTVRANLVGALLQWDNPVVCFVRDNIVVPKVVQLGPLLDHTNFTCDPL